MNIDLNYAKNNDSISVDETFKRLEEDIQLNLVMRKILRDSEIPIF